MGLGRLVMNPPLQILERVTFCSFCVKKSCNNHCSQFGFKKCYVSYQHLLHVETVASLVEATKVTDMQKQFFSCTQDKS